ncbi:Predicted membrane protein [Delftia tsuruhatensis]|nr:Predicted membrane protein [Delftia tsuruhatensis]CAC9683866.1 Predicted membrane protein [Delftia tsuruhatensis]
MRWRKAKAKADTGPFKSGMAAAPGRLRLALRDAIAASLGAMLAWELSHYLLGHPKPVFAAVTALVCLAPGLPSHLKQTWGLVLGCAIGITVGELAWLLPDHIPLLRLSLASLVALSLAAMLGQPPVVPIQAGVSVVLVLSMGPSAAGEVRLVDVLVGAGVGLMFSQVLFTANPLRAMSRSASTLLEQLANGLEATLRATATHDTPDATVALGQLTRSSDALGTLRAAVVEAQSASRWSLRGRLGSAGLLTVTGRYDRHAVRLYASALLLGESLVRGMAHDSGLMPRPVVLHCEWLIEACRQLSANGNVVALAPDDALARLAASAPLPPVHPLPPPWMPALEHAGQMQEALQALIGSRDA